MADLRPQVSCGIRKKAFFYIVPDVVSSSCILTRREALYILPGGKDKLLPSLKFVIADGKVGKAGDVLEGGVAELRHHLNSAHCFNFKVNLLL